MRDVIDAVIGGQRDPRVLADLARPGRLHGRSHGDDADTTRARLHEASQVGDIAREQLVTRKRKQGHQRIDHISRFDASQQHPRVLSVVDFDCPHVDHS